MTDLFGMILELLYVVIGLQFLYTAWRVLRDDTNSKRLGTGLFWIVLGVIFLGGPMLPSQVNGILVCFLGVLTLLKQVKMGSVVIIPEKEQMTASDRYGNKIFLPVITLALSALIIAQLMPEANRISIGVASALATILIVLLTRSHPARLLDESDRMVQQVSSIGILPQLLAALGMIFAAAGVGDVISGIISSVVPMGSPLAAAMAYVLGMVLFTMIMGNAFAAFAVITAGIGIPFVFAQGANPAIAAALAMTAGYCGTLLTPMAGNFNALPVALLEIKNPNGVIREQFIFSAILIPVHIALMYFWAF